MGTLVVCLNIYLVMIRLSAGEKTAKLQIETEYKPDNCSVVAEDGDEVTVHYTGYLENGSIFDSSVQNQMDPIAFILGQGRVIAGWDQGLQGMCVGEKRKLIIPHQLAYGESGYPPVIPENATLTFDTEMISILKDALTKYTTTEGAGSTRGLASFLHPFICACSFLIAACIPLV